MNISNSISFLDLVTPHVELEAEFTAVFQQVLRTASFIGGPMVEQFEREFATFCDVSILCRRGKWNRCPPFRAHGRRNP